MIDAALLELGFRPLLDASPDATVVVDPAGSVVVLNGRQSGSLVGPNASWWVNH
jgi:hypothetical protein